jgi:hypothetical protein
VKKTKKYKEALILRDRGKTQGRFCINQELDNFKESIEKGRADTMDNREP